MGGSFPGRRALLKATAGAVLGGVGVSTWGLAEPAAVRLVRSKARGLEGIGDRVDPWLEVDAEALRFNAAAISAKCGGVPVLSVLKCNAYGLDPAVVAPALESASAVWGYAVVKCGEAMEIRATGCRKPIVMLGDFATSDAIELQRNGVALCTYSRESGPRFAELARKIGRAVAVHIKVDVGLGRLGVPFYEAPQWIADLISSRVVNVQGIFCNLVEVESATEHLDRFKSLVARMRDRGFRLGAAHAAASHAISHLPDSHLDMVRPGIMSYGVYADSTPPGFIELKVAHRLRGRVIRVQQLRPGDAVGYGQRYVAKSPVWTATVMCGWADGYSYVPGNGVQVKIGERRYTLIARTANNTIVELGDTCQVREGDIATLVGPEPGLRPNELSLVSSGGADDGGYSQIGYAAALPKFSR